MTYHNGLLQKAGICNDPSLFSNHSEELAQNRVLAALIDASLQELRND